MAVDDHARETVGQRFAAQGDQLGIGFGNEPGVLAFDDERDQLLSPLIIDLTQKSSGYGLVLVDEVEEGGVLCRKANIRHGQGPELRERVGAALGGLVERTLELFRRSFGHGTQQDSFVRKMTKWRCGRDANFPRQLPHVQSVDPLRIDSSEGGVEEGLAQVAMMIGLGFGRHAPRLSEDVIGAYFLPESM